jgi:hypothetical protein
LVVFLLQDLFEQERQSPESLVLVGLETGMVVIYQRLAKGHLILKQVEEFKKTSKYNPK